MSELEKTVKYIAQRLWTLQYYKLEQELNIYQTITIVNVMTGHVDINKNVSLVYYCIYK